MTTPKDAPDPLPAPPLAYPATDLTDAVAYLRAAVERLACGDLAPRDRALRALDPVEHVQRTRDGLPNELVAGLDRVRQWSSLDPTLEALADRDVVHLSLEIVAAFHEAVRLHALTGANN